MSSLSKISSNSFVFCRSPLQAPIKSSKTNAENTADRVQRTVYDSWYHSADLLRIHPESPKEDRSGVVAFDLRDRFLKLDAAVPDIAFAINDQGIQRYLRQFNKNNVTLESTKKEIQSLDEISQGKVKLNPFLIDFSKQDKFNDLYGYVVHIKANLDRDKLSLYKDFFNSRSMDIQSVYADLHQQDPAAFSACYGNSWDEIPGATLKMALFPILVKQVLMKECQIKPSSWRPSHSIERLVEEIKNKGPLVIGGLFGQAYYRTAPQKLNFQIDGRNIYGWARGERKGKQEVPSLAQTIVVVGAEKRGQEELVFYINPSDQSDVSKSGDQKIYCMSYETFTSGELIVDQYGFLRNNAPKAIPYALYYENSSWTRIHTPDVQEMASVPLLPPPQEGFKFGEHKSNPQDQLGTSARQNEELLKDCRKMNLANPPQWTNCRRDLMKAKIVESEIIKSLDDYQKGCKELIRSINELLKHGGKLASLGSEREPISNYTFESPSLSAVLSKSNKKKINSVITAHLYLLKFAKKLKELGKRSLDPSLLKELASSCITFKEEVASAYEIFQRSGSEDLIKAYAAISVMVKIQQASIEKQSSVHRLVFIANQLEETNKDWPQGLASHLMNLADTPEYSSFSDIARRTCPDLSSTLSLALGFVKDIPEINRKEEYFTRWADKIRNHLSGYRENKLLLQVICQELLPTQGEPLQQIMEWNRRFEVHLDPKENQWFEIAGRKQGNLALEPLQENSADVLIYTPAAPVKKKNKKKPQINSSVSQREPSVESSHIGEKPSNASTSVSESSSSLRSAFSLKALEADRRIEDPERKEHVAKSKAAETSSKQSSVSKSQKALQPEIQTPIFTYHPRVLRWFDKHGDPISLKAIRGKQKEFVKDYPDFASCTDSEIADRIALHAIPFEADQFIRDFGVSTQDEEGKISFSVPVIFDAPGQPSRAGYFVIAFYPRKNRLKDLADPIAMGMTVYHRFVHVSHFKGIFEEDLEDSPDFQGQDDLAKERTPSKKSQKITVIQQNDSIKINWKNGYSLTLFKADKF